MHVRLLPLLIAFFWISSASAQSLRDRLGRSILNPDSASLIFELERDNLKNANDSGLYYYFVADRFYTQSVYDSADFYFQRSVRLLDPRQEPSIRSMGFISITKLKSFDGDWDQALAFAQEAYNHALAVPDSNYMAFALFDISVVYHDMEQFDKGVSYGKEALALLEEYEKASPLFRAYALNAIAINFDDWDQPDSALFYHYKVVEDLENLDSVQVGHTFNNIGNTLLKQQNYTEAKKWLEISLGLNRKVYKTNRLATNYTNLFTIAYSLGKFDEAESMLDSAAKYVSLSQSTEKKRDFLEEQYRYHKLRGRLPLAIGFLEEYSTLKDSIFKAERVELMADLEAKYKVETKERELAESRATLAENAVLIGNRNNQLLLLLVLILVVLGVAFFIYYRQKTKNRHLEQEAKLQSILAEQETQKQLLEQRNRISSDLHDNIGAQLTFIVSSLDNLKYVELSKEKMASKVDQISSFTVETVNELRDTIWAMNKESISLEDLQARLSSLIQKARLSCPGVRFVLQIGEEVNSDQKLNSMEGINYYRVAQEAVNNAVKHSGASEITVNLGLENGRVSLKVKDNGKGLPSENGLGNGLGIMRNRAERIGRNLILHSSPQAGTEVCIS